MSVRRDYKPDPRWNTRRNVRRHGLLVIALVVVGAAGGLAAYLSRDAPPTDAVVSVQSDAPQRQDTRAVRQSKPIEIPLPKPKYDFYNVLPEREIELPNDEDSTGTPQTATNAPAARTSTGNPQSTAPATTRKARSTSGYIIQAGSFANYADADRIKASLALLGIKSRIETGAGNDNTTVHRVRIGPIKDPKQLQALRQRLQANDIPSIAIRSD